MAMKRGGIADGVKAVYHFHRTLEAAQGVTASKVQEFVDGLKEIAFMAITLVAVVGGLWLITSAMSLFRKVTM
jgi:hypothetical protein